MASPNRIRVFLLAAVAAACTLVTLPAKAGIQLFVSVNAAPPALPVYAQPVCPGAGYLWTPGYWAYGPRGYHWMTGAWVRPPQPGMLWTPAWWGMEGGHYRFHAGYWGPHVGYYGGVRYGFGYPGTGFEGGEWRGREFFYNADVNHVDEVHMRNFYRHERHFEEHGGPHGEFREHHDNGNHEGWDRRDEHHDNGRRDGWGHDDHDRRDGWGHDDHDHGHGHDR